MWYNKPFNTWFSGYYIVCSDSVAFESIAPNRFPKATLWEHSTLKQALIDKYFIKTDTWETLGKGEILVQELFRIGGMQRCISWDSGGPQSGETPKYWGPLVHWDAPGRQEGINWGAWRTIEKPARTETASHQVAANEEGEDWRWHGQFVRDGTNGKVENMAKLIYEIAEDRFGVVEGRKVRPMKGQSRREREIIRIRRDIRTLTNRFLRSQTEEREGNLPFTPIPP